MSLNFGNNFTEVLIIDAILYFITFGLIKYITYRYDTEYLVKPLFIGYNLLGLFWYKPVKFAVLSFVTVTITFLLSAFV